MKKILLLSAVILGSFAFSSCEKCADCTSNVDTRYKFNTGDQVNVTSGSVVYKGTEYNVGQSFVIAEDADSYENGLRFEGTGTARLETEICGKSHTYDNAKELYEDNGWTCTE